MMRLLIAVLAVAVMFSVAPDVGYAQTVHNLTPADDWLGVLNGEGLSPGDEVVLGAGTYTVPDNTTFTLGHVGTAANPIVIRAADGAKPVITRNTFGAYNDYFQNLRHNVINVRGAQHVTLDGIEITGGNWGVRIGHKTNGQNPNPLTKPMGDVVRETTHFTLQNSYVHHTHNTAISANFPGEVYSDLTFRRNEISHSGRYGEAFYMGNYTSNQILGVVKDSVIEGNYIHDQVWVNSWYQDPAHPGYHGTAIQFKDGSFNNVVRDNVIHYTKYPGILISGATQSQFSDPGEDNEPNLVEGNIIWQISQAPADITGQGMQIAADAVIRNNIVYAPQPFYNSNHQALSGNLTIVHNTFISSTGGETLKLSVNPSDIIVVANNALYRAEGSGSVITGTGANHSNVKKHNNVAIMVLLDDLMDPANLDFFPAFGSSLAGAGTDLAALDTLYGLDALMSAVTLEDFNTMLRTGDQTAGAYIYDALGNPGWIVGPEFKIIPEPATMGLLGLGLAGIAAVRRRRGK